MTGDCSQSIKLHSLSWSPIRCRHSKYSRSNMYLPTQFSHMNSTNLHNLNNMTATVNCQGTQITEYHRVIMEVDSKTYRFCTAWLSTCGTHQIKNLVPTFNMDCQSVSITVNPGWPELPKLRLSWFPRCTNNSRKTNPQTHSEIEGLTFTLLQHGSGSGHDANFRSARHRRRTTYRL